MLDVAIPFIEKRAATPERVVRQFFESIPWPVWVLAGIDSQLSDMNRQGRTLLEKGRCVRLSEGRLIPAACDAERAWRDALQTVRSKSPYATAPVQRKGEEGYFVFMNLGGAGAPTDAVAVALAGQKVYRAELRAVRSAFRLTEAETRLLGLLLEGKTLDEACRSLAIMRATGRTHLRSLFEKTDTHRQVELLLLVRDFPSFLE